MGTLAFIFLMIRYCTYLLYELLWGGGEKKACDAWILRQAAVFLSTNITQLFYIKKKKKKKKNPNPPESKISEIPFYHSSYWKALIIKVKSLSESMLT